MFDPAYLHISICIPTFNGASSIREVPTPKFLNESSNGKNNGISHATNEITCFSDNLGAKNL